MSKNRRSAYRRTARLAAGTAVALLLTAAAATAAQAHVTVHPETTAGGAEDAEIGFRVPSESATASTVKIQVTLPTSPPLIDVTVRATPGWTASVTEAKLPAPVQVEGTTITKAPHTVTWIATRGNGIPPEQYQDFAIMSDPLPESGTLVFPTLQTYSDGSVVKWTTVQTTGAPEPANPAPSFTITAPTDGSTAADAGATGAGSGGTASSSSNDHEGVTLAGVALGAAAFALAISVIAIVRARRPQGS